MFEGHGATPDLPSLDETFVQERTITGTKAFGADTALVLWNSNPDESTQSAMEEYVQVSAQGLVNYGTNNQAYVTDVEVPFPFPTYTQVPIPLACGEVVAFDIPAQDSGYDYDGDGVNDTLAVHTTTTLGVEDVTVPVGSFPGALRVERNIVTTVVESRSKTTSQGKQTQVDWYASGVGPIKRTAVHSGRTYEFELIAYAAGGVSRGFMPPTMLARDLPQNLGAVEDGQAGAAIGFDGANFLAVVPTGSITYSSASGGGLQAYVVAPDGTTLASAPLLDASESAGFPVIAFNGTRYMVAYVDAGYSRVELVVVSPMAENLDGPIVLSKDPPTVPPNVAPNPPDTGGSPSVVATKNGFLVGYSKVTGTTATGMSVSNLWLAPVDSTGHATDRVVPFPDGPQGATVLATDGTTVLGLWPQGSTQSTSIYGARFDATGHPIDTAPFLVSSAQVSDISNLQVTFDGTQFVAFWVVPGSSSWTARVARIALDGTLRDGPASAGGVAVGIPSGTRPGPGLGRLGTGSVIVWGWLEVSQFRYGIAATRYTVDGQVLDVSPTIGGLLVEGPLAMTPFAEYPHPSIAWGADRSLMVWSADIGNDTSGYDLAPVFPW